MEDTILSFICQVSLIGLGLVIALYAIIMQSLDEIGKKRVKEYKKIDIKTGNTFERVKSDQENEELVSEYHELVKQKKNFVQTPYHYNWGYIVSGMLFAVTTIFPMLTIFYGVSTLGNFAFFVENAPIFLTIGILNFLYIWFRTMIDLRNLTLTKFDILEAKEEKETEKQKKELN